LNIIVEGSINSLSWHPEWSGQAYIHHLPLIITGWL